jgi:hypothetical protein
MAPAASAAARARLGAGRCERDINIMPIRSRPDGNANSPTGPSPPRQNCCQFKQLGASCIPAI